MRICARVPQTLASGQCESFSGDVSSFTRASRVPCPTSVSPLCRWIWSLQCVSYLRDVPRIPFDARNVGLTHPELKFGGCCISRVVPSYHNNVTSDEAYNNWHIYSIKRRCVFDQIVITANLIDLLQKPVGLYLVNSHSTESKGNGVVSGWDRTRNAQMG